jgi:hypothetical protein
MTLERLQLNFLRGWVCGFMLTPPIPDKSRCPRYEVALHFSN